MAEQSWKSAILTILTESKEPLHYSEITERIMTRGLKTTAGATPDATVNAQISASIKHDGSDSPFLRVAKGTFTLRPKAGIAQPSVGEPEVEVSDGVIRAFGIHWQREHVVWRRQPRLFGRQQVAAKSVDFSAQRGVYVLSDHHTVIYVGRAVERDLGQRLYEHTIDSFLAAGIVSRGSAYTAFPTLASSWRRHWLRRLLQLLVPSRPF